MKNILDIITEYNLIRTIELREATFKSGLQRFIMQIKYVIIHIWQERLND